MIGASFAGLVLMLFAGNTLALLLIASALFGTIYSFCAVGCSLVTRDVFGNKQYGTAYSVFSVIFNVSTALAISLIGKIYDVTGHYRAALLFIIGCEAATVILLVITQRVTRKKSIRKISSDDVRPESSMIRKIPFTGLFSERRRTDSGENFCPFC